MRHTVNTPIDARPEGSTLATPVRRVMVGTDRSETSDQAVRWAASFAGRCGAELVGDGGHGHGGRAQRVRRLHALGCEAATPAQFEAQLSNPLKPPTIAGGSSGRLFIDRRPPRPVLRPYEDVFQYALSKKAGSKRRLELPPSYADHNEDCS
jgi:Universal stress protein family